MTFSLALTFQILLLSNKVWHSPTVRAELVRAAQHQKLNSEVLVRAVKTRWNTIAAVTKRSLHLKPVLANVCDMTQFNQGTRGQGGLRLRRFILKDYEWDIIKDLDRLLDVSIILNDSRDFC